MNIVCACPACQMGIYQTSVENASSIICPACGQSVAVPQGAIQVSEKNAQPRLNRCLVCPSTELFVRKNFPQRLGIAIVVIMLSNKPLLVSHGLPPGHQASLWCVLVERPVIN